MAIKRLNYFDHQFLVAGDFIAEQAYHREMRHRLNQRLYTEGIVDGLEVTKSADKAVTVSRGAAIDRLGQEMFWEPGPDQPGLDVSAHPGGTPIYIIIAYQEQASDPTTATGVSGNTRVTEQPVVRAVTALPTAEEAEEAPVVPLAHFTLAANGDVPGGLLDGDVRQMVRPRNEQGLASVNEVSHPGGNVDLEEGPGIRIEPNPDTHSITIAASGTQGLVSVNGVSSPGGNIDLVPALGQAIEIRPDNDEQARSLSERPTPPAKAMCMA